MILPYVDNAATGAEGGDVHFGSAAFLVYNLRAGVLVSPLTRLAGQRGVIAAPCYRHLLFLVPIRAAPVAARSSYQARRKA